MINYKKTGNPSADELLFLPLGGSGEIGMNLNLYGHDGKWLIVDVGITFGDSSTTPGVDVIMPDPSFIAKKSNQISAIILTHGHEDHLGAVQYLWPKLKCPIYATPFTAAFLRRKLADCSFINDIEIIEIPLSSKFSVDKFDIELISLTHSILEPNALLIKTPVGNVMHTGDWKLDPDPALGEKSDKDALIKAGDEGVLAMVCDSTNALNDGWSGSEGEIRKNLIDLVASKNGKVAIACFASNVARLESAVLAGVKNGRKIALVGRSLWRIVDAAKEAGYLKNSPKFLEAGDVKGMPANKILYICTGSQGEPRAALSRIAVKNHPDVSLVKGDCVVFSSREIPGNEISISHIQNSLIEQNIEIITANDYNIHASGHPYRDELRQMYQWVRPHIAIPVHGEARHLEAHATLATESGISHSMAARNGRCMSLTKDGVEIVDEVFSSRLYLDGNRLLPMDNNALKSRRKMSWNGFVLISLVIDDDGDLLIDPEITVEGLFNDDEDEKIDKLISVAEDALNKLGKKAIMNDDKIREAIRISLSRICKKTTSKRPIIRVHLARV